LKLDRDIYNFDYWLKAGYFDSIQRFNDSKIVLFYVSRLFGNSLLTRCMVFLIT